MSKHTKQKILDKDISLMYPAVERLGVIALTALGLLVSFEAVLEHAGNHQTESHSSSVQYVNQVFARADAKGETARLPEEFDIGLQAPHVTGI